MPEKSPQLLPDPKPKMQNTMHRGIAVVGIGCRYPGANDTAALWENILARRQAFRRMPEARFSLNDHYHPDRDVPDKTYHTRAALLDGFVFDWRAMRIPKTTFETTDIAHWLALEVALAAIRDAGYDTSSLPKHRTSVLVGNSLTGEGWRTNIVRLRWPFVARALTASAKAHELSDKQIDALLSSMETNFKNVFPDVTEDTLAGGLSNTIAGRICNYLDAHGGGYVVDGACASSLLSIITASRALVANEIDLAIAGGVDISLDTFELIGFAKTGALSATDMRVYDRDACGFLPGEGCGFVVLKRFEDAQRDGDRIYAVIQGWGISSDGKGGITAPSVEGQARAIVQAYQTSGYTPQTLDFIEGHGTATTLGDRVEVAAIQRAFDAFGNGTHHDLRPVGVTSLKSVVGHTKAAAGVGGFIKAALALHQRVIPPTASCVEPNRIFDEEAHALYPLIHGRRCEPQAKLRAGVSAMGFGGINSHITLESGDSPDKRLTAFDEQSLMAHAQDSELIVLSGENTAEVLERIRIVRDRTHNLSMAELADLSALCIEELKLISAVRAALIVQSPEELTEWLDKLEEKLNSLHKGESYVSSCKKMQVVWDTQAASSAPKLAFAFPGQGVELLDMARNLVERFSWARQIVSDAERWLAEVEGPSLADKLWRDIERAPTSESLKQWQAQLIDTQIAQPAIALVTLLWMQRFKTLGVKPDIVVGHSLGELSSLYAANAIDAETYIKLAALRGRVMAEAASRADYAGAMASLSCSRQKAEALIASVEDAVCIANHNSFSQVVVSGAAQAVERVLEMAAAEKIAALRLGVSAAFHSPQMFFAQKEIAGVEMRNTQVWACEVVSSMTGKPLQASTELSQHLSAQIVSPVEFVKAVTHVLDAADMMLEVGPGAVLTGLATQIAKHIATNKNEKPGARLLCVEGRPNRIADFNIAVGSLFVRGVALQLNALHEARLIKSFVPAGERVFIENVCERAFRNETDQRMLSLGHTAPVKLPLKHSKEKSLSFQSQPNTDIAAELIQLVAQTTGFAQESLELEYRFLDDLHLDSIKTADIVARLAKKLALSAEVDPTRFANARLADVISSLQALIDNAAQNLNHDLNAKRTGLEAPTFTTWVRNFELVWEQAPFLDSRETAALAAQNASILFLLDDSSQMTPVMQPIIQAVAQAFRNTGAHVDTKNLEGADSVNAERYTDYVGVFNSENPIEQNIKKLAKLVSLLPTRSDTEQTLSVVELCTHDADLGKLGSFFASFHLERPSFRVRVLSFDNSSVSTSDITQALTNERVGAERFVQARYINHAREVRKPVLRHPAQDSMRDTQLTQHDVVLVTGGARGITAECALALGQKTGATFILLGRSAESSARDMLQRFEARGVRAVYRSCDVSKRDEVLNVVSELRSRFGAITAVIHGAGLNRPERLETVDEAKVLAEVAPKSLGARYLFEAFDKSPPKLFVAFGSIIGFTGMVGNAWYALSNAQLASDLRVFGQRHPKTETVILDYSVWDEVGMGKDLGSIDILKRSGIEAIPVAEGVARFLHFVERKSEANEIVIAARLGDLDTWKLSTPQIQDTLPQRSFIETITTFAPGIEIQVKTDLTFDRDPYLKDHNFRGSHLFPTVFGLEAMAQATERVLGRSLGSALHIDDIELSHPLVVSPSEGLTIVIHANVLERKNQEEPLRVKAAIRSATSSFAYDHFSATFVLDTLSVPNVMAEATESDLGIDPKETLYGTVLFQGPRFQRIHEIHRLDASTCHFSAIELHNNDWVLGDPYFRDSLLQSAQLCVTPEICLPVRIDRMTIRMTPTQEASESVVRSCQTNLHNSVDGLRATVNVFDKSGACTQSIEGYQVRALGRNPALPSTAELVATSNRYAKQLSTRFNKAVSAHLPGFQLPAISFQPLSRLRFLPTEERHASELALMQSTVELALSKRSERRSDDDTVQIRWSERGKPLIEGNDTLDISLAHDDGFAICAVGEGAQGCDIEPMESRGFEGWQQLFPPALRGHFQEVAGNNMAQVDLLGTCFWTAMEATRKALPTDSENRLNFKLNLRFQDLEKMRVLIFEVSDCSFAVVSLLFDVEQKKTRAAALVVHPQVVSDQLPKQSYAWLEALTDDTLEEDEEFVFTSNG